MMIEILGSTWGEQGVGVDQGACPPHSKAGTTSMLHILGAHPDIVAASDSEFDAYAVSEAVTPMEAARVVRRGERHVLSIVSR